MLTLKKRFHFKKGNKSKRRQTNIYLYNIIYKYIYTCTLYIFIVQIMKS